MGIYLPPVTQIFPPDTNRLNLTKSDAIIFNLQLFSDAIIEPL